MAVKSTMTRARYRLAIKRLGLNQTQASRFLGVSDRQGRRWALGEAEVDEAVNLLLRIMLAHELTPEDVAKLRDGDLTGKIQAPR